MSKTYKNVLVLMSDQHKQTASGCYGSPWVHTPNIDSLAQTGVKFNRAYTTCPLCGPARAAMLTGAHPHVNGNVTHPNSRHRSGESYHAPLHNNVQSLALTFKEKGYQTYSAGYLGIHGYRDGKMLTEKDMGFDKVEITQNDHVQAVGKDVANAYHRNGIHGEMWEPAYHNVQDNTWPYDESQLWDSMIADKAIAFLQSSAEQPEQPFFAHVGFRAPHTPWVPPKRFRDLYKPNDIGPIPNYSAEHEDKPRRLLERFKYFDCHHYPEDLVRSSMCSYFGFVSFMDDCIGRILKELDRVGLREDTLIIYTTDHGEMLFEHGLCEKHCMLESTVRIPLIFSMPGSGHENTSSNALVENTDILPTALELCGIEIPRQQQDICGKSLIPSFSGSHVHERIYSEYYHSLDPTRMVFDGRYKFVYTLDDINELYDMENDPEEMHNLCFYPAYKDIATKMEQWALENWQRPDLPIYATWNDLNERKQLQLQNGLELMHHRPKAPDFVRQYSEQFKA